MRCEDEDRRGNGEVSIFAYAGAMLMKPISLAEAVPAEALFPTWRGREPYRERAKAVADTLRTASPGLDDAVDGLPF
jgi:hypothetical protein